MDDIAEIHKTRWIIIGIWALIFSVLVAWTLNKERIDNNKTTDRFCEITSAFITSNLRLRDSEDRLNIREIGLRQAQLGNSKHFLRLVKSSKGMEPRLRIVLIEYLDNEIQLDTALINDSQRLLVATNQAAGKWTQLRKDLRC